MKYSFVVAAALAFTSTAAMAKSLQCTSNKPSLAVVINLDTSTAVIWTKAEEFMQLTDGEQPYQLSGAMKVTADDGGYKGDGIDLRIKGNKALLTAQTAVKFTTPIKNIKMECKGAN